MRRRPDHPDMFDQWARLAARVEAQTQAVHREGKLRRRMRNAKSSWTPARQTLSDIADLIQRRHGRVCDTDEGEIYLEAALPWLVDHLGGFNSEGFRSSVLAWAAVFTPRVTNAAADACIRSARQRDERKRLYWSAGRLGEMLKLTLEEREALDIRRIRPAGMTEAEFQTYRRGRKAAQRKASRRAEGARPREQSAAQLEPWAALGMSRRTYYRQKAAGQLPGQIRDAARARGTVSSPIDPKDLLPTSERCHAPERGVPGPARKAGPRQIVGAGGHTPGGKTRAVPAGHARALPLPMEGVSEHPELPGLDDWIPLGKALEYAGGLMPPEVAQAVRTAQRVRMMTQEAVARHIGISRPQLANALQGRFGLSRSAAENLRAWLAAA